MLNGITYPEWFKELLHKAALVKSLPINSEITQTFWEHVKKFSVDRDNIARALDSVVEDGAFLDPAAVINRLPRRYPEEKNWPEWDEVKKASRSGIGRDCIALIEAKMNEDIDQQQFHQGMLDLDGKYPNAGFSDAAKRYGKNAGI